MTPAKTQWPNVILGVIGICTSAWAVHVHRLAKAGQDTGCGITDTITCDKVLTSKWSELFGIPVGFYGLIFFGIVIIMAIASGGTRVSARQFALQNLTIASAGFLGSLVFSYISLRIIGAACPVCMSTHLTNTLLFAVSLAAFLRTRRQA